MTTVHDPSHHHHRARPVGDHRPGRPATGPIAGRQDQPGAADPAELLLGDRLALTVTEAGALLGISRALAYELVARGELQSVRLGRRLVVPKVAVLELLGLRPRRGQ